MNQLVVGLAMLGCTGAWAALNVPRVYRWLTRKACLHCGKPKLVVHEKRDGGTRVRCALCRAEYYCYDGKLIGRAAFEAGARDPFPQARLR